MKTPEKSGFHRLNDNRLGSGYSGKEMTQLTHSHRYAEILFMEEWPKRRTVSPTHT